MIIIVILIVPLYYNIIYFTIPALFLNTQITRHVIHCMVSVANDHSRGLFTDINTGYHRPGDLVTHSENDRTSALVNSWR